VRDRDRVVVLVGASSGIGRATALRLARRRTPLVLAARSAETLEELAGECRALGAPVLTVPTDVSDEDQVRRLADRAVQRFGRIDAWVGAASVFSYGGFEDTPSEVFRQQLETNLFGQVYSARAVLPVFRAQGGGAIVFIASIYSRVTSPYASGYITSKHALMGFAETLRQEVERDGISVSTVLPATIDTPIYQHAANFTGRRVHPLPPIVSPERVARVIVRVSHTRRRSIVVGRMQGSLIALHGLLPPVYHHAANYTGRRVHPLPPIVSAERAAAAIVRVLRRPRRAVVVGRVQSLLVPLHGVAPSLYSGIVRPAMDVLALRRGSVAPSPGNVFAPQPELNRVAGGWRWPARVRVLPLAALTALAGLLLLPRRRVR
jgi:short-subunit dehydrogenase